MNLAHGIKYICFTLNTPCQMTVKHKTPRSTKRNSLQTKSNRQKNTLGNVVIAFDFKLLRTLSVLLNVLYSNGLLQSSLSLEQKHCKRKRKFKRRLRVKPSLRQMSSEHVRR